MEITELKNKLQNAVDSQSSPSVLTLSAELLSSAFYRELQSNLGVGNEWVIISPQITENNGTLTLLGTTSLLFIENLSIQLDLSISSNNINGILTSSLAQNKTAPIPGFSWLSFSTFGIVFNCSDDGSMSTGTIQSRISNFSFDVNGLLEINTNGNPEVPKSQWVLSSPADLTQNYVIQSLLPQRELNSETFDLIIAEKNDFITEKLNRLGLTLIPNDSHQLVCATKLSWEIFSGMTVQNSGILLQASPNNNQIFQLTGVGIVGEIRLKSLSPIDLTALISPASQGLSWDFDLKTADNSLITIENLSGDLLTEAQLFSLLPVSLKQKILGSGLRELRLKLEPALRDFYIYGDGNLLGLDGSVWCSIFSYNGQNTIALQLFCRNEPKPIPDIISDNLGISLEPSFKSRLPQLALAIREITYDQQSQAFTLVGLITHDSFILESRLFLQWSNGMYINFSLIAKNNTPVTLTSLADSLSLSIDGLNGIIPNKIVDKIGATSFSHLEVTLNTAQQDFEFFGIANLFGSLPVNVSFSVKKINGKSSIDFTAFIYAEPLLISELFESIGIQIASDYIPRIGGALRKIAFNQAQKKFDIEALIEIGQSKSDILFEVETKIGGTVYTLDLEGDPNAPPSLVAILGAFLPKPEADKLSLPLGINISLQSIKLTMDAQNQSQTGHIQVTVSIASVDFILTADRAESDSGWQFQGNTGPGQNIPIGTLLGDIKDIFGIEKPLPEPLKKLSIKNLHLSFNTGTKNFSFGCEGDFPVEGKEVAIRLNIELTKQPDESYKKDFKGYITLGPFQDVGTLQFNLHFLQDNNATLFAATYSHQGGDSNINLGALIAQLSPNITHIPIDLSVDLKDIILVFDKKPNQATKFLFALDISAGLNLSKLPLIGKEFPPDKSVGVDDLQFILTNAPIPQTEVQSWISQNLLPSTVTPLPARDLNQGLSIDGKLNLGGFSQAVNLPVSGSNTPPVGSNPPPLQNATPPTSPDKAKWFTLQKQIGPIYFERIGVQYEKGKLWFLLDASLTAAGLSIALQGLSVGSSLKEFKPEFRLDGLGIDYKKGPLEIGGAFLRFGESEYNGTAIIKTEALSLAAIGAYAELADGHKSLFIYAVLDEPLGGPAFFFVTGLAAGFGYNRRLRIPGINQVQNFPLVSEVVNGTTPIPPGAGQRNALMGELTKIRTYIPPETGQYFLAVGIKFNSFKLIDSFALLTISFGNHFELDLLGLSTLVVPTPEANQLIDPLAEVQMAIKASFIPDEGFFGLEAQLTTASFLLSRKCHLTGGFAFYSWFKGVHKGDFVTTLGGYHPSYKVPAHYPKVPRLGFNWQVTTQLSLKGEAYFALTASALMAGGRLEALWLDGNLRAWFIAGADFLIAWKPYHYDARVYVDMGVSYTFKFFGTHSISVDVGADLHIWGPDFSGNARVKLWIITFHVIFGAAASQSPKPIDWTTFRTSFLPADDKDMASISLLRGVKSQPDAASGVDWIIDVKHFEFETNSVIPLKQGRSAADNQAFGIAPMNLASDQVDSSLQLSIKDPGGKDISADFQFEPILKNVPIGMWGTSVNPNLNGQKFIKNALTGYRIKLVKQEKEPTHKAAPIDRHKFQFSTTEIDNYLNPVDVAPFFPTSYTDWKDRLKQNRQTNPRRDSLLEALGFSADADVQLSDSYVDELIFAPQFAGAEAV